MSKMDDLRAMREARYEQAAARGSRATAKRPATPRTAPPAAEGQQPTSGPTGQQPQLLVHRAISVRTCTREHGHGAKSHAYSGAGRERRGWSGTWTSSAP